MFKIADKPFFKELKEFVSSDAQVSINLSDPYYSDPFNIKINILQITNESSIRSMSWSVMPAYEEVLPELVVTQNSVSFEKAYYFGGMVLQLSVLLKNGQYQYYYVPVDLEGIPPFEAACEHSGEYLEIMTNSTGVRFEINGENTGDISLTGEIGYGTLLYSNGTIDILYYDSDGEYSKILNIHSGSYSSEYTPTTIKFYPNGYSYVVFTDLSNFPLVFDGDGYTTEVDISNLGYDANGYFIANNCCFLPEE